MSLKKHQTLTFKVCLAWLVALIVSNVVIGTFSYVLYRNQLMEARALEAQNVALAMAVRIDGEKFTSIMDTLEKNDYWYEVKEYADRIAVVFDTSFIYILDNEYTDEVTYFAEGAPGDAPFDLGVTEIIEDVYADEMFETLRTGNPSYTDPYPSGEYGDMVSGFAAITDKNGNVAGVVGVDFLYNDIQGHLAQFALTMVVIITVFVVGMFFLMFYLGDMMAGRPLTRLDSAAQQFALGDMDIDFNIKSSTEIGRLADSFSRAIDAMRYEITALEKLAQGDLTPRVKLRGDKDTMGIAIARILDSLNEMFQEIHHSATSVSTGARQMSDNAQSLAQGTTEQSSSVERLSASIADVSDKAKGNLEVAAKTNELARTIKSDAQVGAENMNRMTQAVKEITDASMSINKVIKVIDDIAFQTNILALNAAVEAARAGQHGKGFAVVAEEVRNLASKSAEAAQDTERLIMNSMEKAQLGSSIADETVESLDRIIQGINECATLVDTIAGSFEEQIGSISQINQEIVQVSNVVHQNSATAEESAAASEEMSGQASLLEDLVARFKLRGQ